MDARAQRHRRGEPAFRRASLAIFAAGVATFMLLYAPQPMLAAMAGDLGVSPAGATLTLSVATATLTLALLPAGWLSNARGRTGVIRVALLAAAGLGLAAAAAPTYAALLVLRALQGVAIAGVPAVAMAYLAEEIEPSSLGSAIGLYIGGSALGGMTGRLLSGALAELGGWHLALAGVGAVSLACAAVFWHLAPASRHHTRTRFTPAAAFASVTVHLQDRGQRLLVVMAALLVGTFVAVYNALGFRLAGARYGLSAAAIGAVFLVYPIGSVSSTVAGGLADVVGRRRMLPAGVLITFGGVALMALDPLPLIVLGVALLTLGFFAAHSIASSWVGRRAQVAPAQASALYLLGYYTGSSVFGPLGGVAWSDGGWPAVSALATLLLATAFGVSLRLRATPPLAPPQSAGPEPLTA
jgi:YNFM family putative membrane transporter